MITKQKRVTPAILGEAHNEIADARAKRDLTMANNHFNILSSLAPPRLGLRQKKLRCGAGDLLFA